MTAARFSTGGLRGCLVIRSANPAKQGIEFGAQMMAVKTVRPCIQPEHDVERLQLGSQMAKCFARNTLDQIARIGTLEMPLRHHHAKTRSADCRRPVMNHEMPAALRAPQCKNG